MDTEAYGSLPPRAAPGDRGQQNQADVQRGEDRYRVEAVAVVGVHLILRHCLHRVVARLDAVPPRGAGLLVERIFLVLPGGPRAGLLVILVLLVRHHHLHGLAVLLVLPVRLAVQIRRAVQNFHCVLERYVLSELEQLCLGS